MIHLLGKCFYVKHVFSKHIKCSFYHSINKIHTHGWHSYKIDESLISIISNRLMLLSPTDIQKAVLQTTNSGKNVLIFSPGGSGKSLAALLHLFPSLNNENHSIILVPTKLLAKQWMSLLNILLSQSSLRTDICVGGESTSASHENLKSNPPNILICTPHKLSFLLSSSDEFATKMKNLNFILIDEVDVMAGNTMMPSTLKCLSLLRPPSTCHRVGLMATPPHLLTFSRDGLQNETEILMRKRIQPRGDMTQISSLLGSHDPSALCIVSPSLVIEKEDSPTSVHNESLSIVSEGWTGKNLIERAFCLCVSHLVPTVISRYLSTGFDSGILNQIQSSNSATNNLDQLPISENVHEKEVTALINGKHAASNQKIKLKSLDYTPPANERRLVVIYCSTTSFARLLHTFLTKFYLPHLNDPQLGRALTANCFNLHRGMKEFSREEVRRKISSLPFSIVITTDSAALGLNFGANANVRTIQIEPPRTAPCGTIDVPLLLSRATRSFLQGNITGDSFLLIASNHAGSKKVAAEVNKVNKSQIIFPRNLGSFVFAKKEDENLDKARMFAAIPDHSYDLCNGVMSTARSSFNQPAATNRSLHETIARCLTSGLRFGQDKMSQILPTPEFGRQVIVMHRDIILGLTGDNFVLPLVSHVWIKSVLHGQKVKGIRLGNKEKMAMENSSKEISGIPFPKRDLDLQTVKFLPTVEEEIQLLKERRINEIKPVRKLHWGFSEVRPHKLLK